MFLSKPSEVFSAKSARIVHSFVAVLAFLLTTILVLIGLPAAALPDDSSSDSVSAVSSSRLVSPFTYPGDLGQASGFGANVSSNASYESLMEVTDLSPALIRPSNDVRVSIKVTNTLNKPIDQATVDFNLTRVRFTTRSGLDSWDARGLDSIPGSKLASETLSEPLEPGKTATFDFKVPATQFALLGGYEGWGPRGVRFALYGSVDDSSALIDAVDTYIIWYPAEDLVTPNLNVSTMVPITGMTLDPLNAQADNVEVEHLQNLTQVGKDKPLSAILDAISGNDHVALAVNPELIESLDIASGNNPYSLVDSVEVSPAPEPSEPVEPTIEQVDAVSWLEQFTEISTTHEILQLPAYDADWASYIDTDASIPLSSTGTTKSLESIKYSGSVAWPTADGFSAHVVTAASAEQFDITIAENLVMLDDPESTFTHSGVKSVLEAPNTTLFDADEGLNSLLTTPHTDSPVVERQRLIAELAVISKEQPSAVRNIVIAPGRDWNPDPATAKAQLSVLPSLPWISTSPVSKTSSEKHETVSVNALPQNSSVNVLSSESFTALKATQKQLTRFARVVEDSSSISDPHANALTRLTSQAWLQDRSGLTTAENTYKRSAQQLLDSIVVVPSSDINLISTGAEIPVTVKNDLGQVVTLQIRLKPSDSRLQAAEAIPAIIPAHSTKSIRIPVTAVGSGNVNVSVEILDEVGKHVSTPGSFDVRVRADWENVGTGVVIALLVLLLVGGIWRTIRRGRSERRTDGLDVDDALAVVQSDPEELR